MAEAIQQSASVFRMAGLEVNEFSALVGTATSATQLGGSQIARGLRTILLRMQGVTDEATDSTEDSISKLDEVMQKYDIQIRKNAMQFKNPMESLQQITEAFNTTLKNNKVAQMEILNVMAGKRQANIAAGIIENWDMVQKQVYEAMYATGSAIRENEIYMGSWEAKSKQLSSAVSQFWNETLDTDAIKKFIDGLRQIIEFVTEFKLAIPILAGVIMAVLIPSFTAILTKLAAINVAAGGLPVIIGLVTTSLVALSMNTDKLTKSMNEFNSSATTMITKQTDMYNSEAERIKNIEKMTDRLDELNEIQDLTNDEQIEQKTIIDTLNKIYPTLRLNVDNLSDSYDIQRGKIQQLTREDKNHLKEKLQNAKKLAEFERDTALQSNQAANKKYEIANKQLNASVKAVEFLEKNRKKIGKTINRNMLKFIEENKDVLLEDTGVHAGVLRKKLYTDAFDMMLGKDPAQEAINYYKKRISGFREEATESLSKVEEIRSAEEKLRLATEKLNELEKYTIETPEQRKSRLIWEDIEKKIREDKKRKELQADLKANAELQRKKQQEEKRRVDIENAQIESIYPARVSGMMSSVVKDRKEIQDLESSISLLSKPEQASEKLALQKKLIDLKEHALENIIKTRTKLKNEINKLQGKTKYDILSWLTPEGEKTEKFVNLFNSLGASGQEAITQIKDDLKSLSDAERDMQGNALNFKREIQVINNQILETEKQIQILAQQKMFEQLPARIREILVATKDLNSEVVSLEKQISRADKDKDYTKSLELQNKLLEARRGIIDKIKETQKQLSAEADKVRATTTYDTTKWFLPTGETNTYYQELYSSLDDIGKAHIEKVKDALMSLGDAWRDGQDDINGYTEEIDNLMYQTEETIKRNEELEEENTKNVIEAYKRRIETIETAEGKIQDIIRKGIDLKKEALDEEYEKVKENQEKEIKARRKKWEAIDLEKQKKKDEKDLLKIQKKVDALARASTLSAVAERKKLEEELAEEKSRIEDENIKRRRENEIAVLEDTISYKKDSIEKEKSLIDEQWNRERVILESRDALFNQSFDKLRSEFPQLFEELGVETGKFFSVFESYERNFNDNVTSMESGIKKIVSQVKDAVTSVDELINKSTQDVQAVELDKARSKIRDLQIEWNRLNEFKQRGLGYDATRMGELGVQASGIRSKYNLPFEDLRNYQSKFGDLYGYNLSKSPNVIPTSTSFPELSPLEWMNFPQQSYNMATGNIPTNSNTSNNNMSFSIVVQGNADAGTVEGLKSERDSILREINDNLRKKGQK